MNDSNTLVIPGSAVDQAVRPPSSKDVDLFARFLAGEDAALMELFDRHTHRLYLYCLKFVGDRVQAEDLVQDLWERVIKLRNKPREAPPNPLGLLYRIARNLSLNSIRDRRQLSSLDTLPEWQHPSVSTREMSQHEELVVAALAHLPLAQREVLILNAYSGYRFDEIAEMLGEPVGAVRTRAWRARVQLGRVVSAMIELDENRENNDSPSDDESNTEDEQ
jgi:RNA polymerase sigma-70 factor (ECF subfamily)